MDFSFPTLFPPLVILAAILVVLSLEYYARKARVVPMPSLPWMRRGVMKALASVVDDLVDLQVDETADGKRIDSPFIYELGSGWGALAVAAAKANPHAKVMGVELSPIPCFVASLRARLGGLKNLRFVNRSFYDMDLSKADVILAYLTVPILTDLRPKLESELREGTYIICHTFPVPDWHAKSIEKVTKMIYDFNVYIFEFGQHKSV